MLRSTNWATLTKYSPLQKKNTAFDKKKKGAGGPPLIYYAKLRIKYLIFTVSLWNIIQAS